MALPMFLTCLDVRPQCVCVCVTWILPPPLPILCEPLLVPLAALLVAGALLAALLGGLLGTAFAHALSALLCPCTLLAATSALRSGALCTLLAAARALLLAATSALRTIALRALLLVAPLLLVATSALCALLLAAASGENRAPDTHLWSLRGACCRPAYRLLSLGMQPACTACCWHPTSPSRVLLEMSDSASVVTVV